MNNSIRASVLLFCSMVLACEAFAARCDLFDLLDDEPNSTGATIVRLIKNRDLKPLVALLDQLPVDSLTMTDLEPLSDGVYKIPLLREPDIYGVLRVSNEADAYQAQWLSQVALMTPRLVVSPVRILHPSRKLTRVIRDKLKASSFQTAKARKRKLELTQIRDSLKPSFVVTLAIFLPGKTGERYVEEKFNMKWRGAFINDMKSLSSLDEITAYEDLGFFSDFQKAKDVFPSLSMKPTDEQRSYLNRDLTEILGNNAPHAADSNFLLQSVRQLFDHISAHGFEAVCSLVSERIFYHLAPWIQTQLADHWAFSHLLIAQDFHRENWVIDESLQTVGRIDLTRIAPELASEASFFSGHFISGKCDSEFVRQLAAPFVSLQMRSWLAQVARDPKLRRQMVGMLKMTPAGRGFRRKMQAGLERRARWLLQNQAPPRR